MSFMYIHRKIWSMMKGGKNIYDTFGGPDCMYVRAFTAIAFATAPQYIYISK